MIRLTVVEISDSLSHVALSGKLDVQGVEEIETSFAGQTAERGRPTIVDVSGLAFIASLGIAMLCDAARTLERLEHGMVLLGPRPVVLDTLVACGIDRVIPIASSRQDALRRLASPPPNEP